MLSGRSNAGIRKHSSTSLLPFSLYQHIYLLTSSLSSEDTSTRVSGRRSMCREERREGVESKRNEKSKVEKSSSKSSQKKKTSSETMRSQSLLLALRGASSLTASTSSSSSSSACTSAAAAALSGFRRYHKNVRESFVEAKDCFQNRRRRYVRGFFLSLFLCPASRSPPALSAAVGSTKTDDTVFFMLSSNERAKKKLTPGENQREVIKHRHDGTFFLFRRLA